MNIITKIIEGRQKALLIKHNLQPKLGTAGSDALNTGIAAAAAAASLCDSKSFLSGVCPRCSGVPCAASGV